MLLRVVSYVVRGEHDEGPRQRLESFALDARVFAVARCQHGVQIRYGAT